MPSKCVKIILLICCFAAGMFTNVTAQSFSITNDKKKAVIPFKLVRNMIIVKMMINNKGPFNFILDTGVGLMVVTEPSLVDSMIMPSKRILNIYGLGDGNSLEAYITPSLKTSIGGVSSPSMSAAILTKDHFGLSNYAGMDIHGLVGYQFFKEFAVKINFLDSSLYVTRAKDMRKLKGAERIPITVENNRPYMNAAVAIADGRQETRKLLIDIGAGHSLLLENKKAPREQTIQQANLGMSFSGPISGHVGRIEEVKLGKYKFDNVITSFPDKDTVKKISVPIFRDGNLGMGILKRFNILINYSEEVMYLKKSAKFREPFEHDMSGIEYYSAGADYKRIMISRVEPGSPADLIGLQKDDEIVSINFKPVKTMSLEEIDEIFRSKDKRGILLNIAHDNVNESVILKLKKRI